MTLRDRVGQRIRAFLGERSALSCSERALRVLEEAAELAQAEGVPQGIAERVVLRVFSRPRGDMEIEGADVGITFLAWCYAAGLDMHKIVAARLDATANMRDRIRTSAFAKAAIGIGLPPNEE